MKIRKPSAAKTCGECRACCVDLKIDTPEFKKEARILCPHHSGSGCGIYATRYKICREFLCGWLLFPELGDDWRPDRSGVIILQKAYDQLPPAYQPAGNGVHLFIPGGEAAINRPGFAAYVADLVSRGVAVYLDVTTPNTLVNEHLQDMVAAGDLAAIARTLIHLHRLQLGAWYKKGFFRILPHLYRLYLEKARARIKNASK